MEKIFATILLIVMIILLIAGIPVTGPFGISATYTILWLIKTILREKK